MHPKEKEERICPTTKSVTENRKALLKDGNAKYETKPTKIQLKQLEKVLYNKKAIIL